MANEEHLAILQRGVEVWNQWRRENPDIEPDLSEADLSGIDLSEADFYQVNFRTANLSHTTLHGAILYSANLNRANLNAADFRGVDLYGVILTGATLIGADFGDAILGAADLSEANLKGANLTRVSLVDTNLSGANLSGCRIYGISAWSTNLTNATQSDLIISQENEPQITVDNLEVAQFVYLLLHNEKIRGVIDTLTTKSVLILGRFTEERKAVLEAIKNELRQRNYVPILFDFEKPASRDLTETIVTLAHLSRFVIADITDAKGIPQELQAIVPNLLSVPIQPIILAAQREYAMFEHFRRYPSVLPLHEYDNQDQLIAELPEKVIEPAERKVIELRPKSS